jgi:adenylylsulfate kinase
MPKGFAIWMTGLPASGKSSLARAVEDRLQAAGIPVQILESDKVRKEILPDSGYSREERDLFYRLLSYIGVLLVENGIHVIFDATANRREYRDLARKGIPRFMEVFVRCPLAVCQSRDPKGIYRRGREGETRTVPGLQEPYEEPEFPEVVVDSEGESPGAGAEKVVRWLTERHWIQADR